jgi:hypothetical protein
MASSEKEQGDLQDDCRDEDIQDEIRRRILKEAQKKDGKRSFEEATRATLDALEDMVSISREDMEKIAEQVKSDYKQAQSPVRKKKGGHWIYPWTGLGLMILTFYLARRGSSWYLFTGLILEKVFRQRR